MKASFRVLTSILFTLTFVPVARAQNNYNLNPLASFGGNLDGSIRPGDTIGLLTLDNTFNQRGLAYDPVSGNLVLVDTHSGTAGSNAVQGAIYILDGTSGAFITTLATNGIVGGNYADTSVAVADDGAVYVCNQVSPSGSIPFKIYRWGGVTDTAAPLIAFSNVLSPSQRYGTSMDIRGSGPSTQIIIGAMLGSSATNVVIFSTTDGTNFVANVIACTNLINSSPPLETFNQGIAFGIGNTFWGKAVGQPLRLMSFDLTAKTASIQASFTAASGPVLQNLGPIAVDNVNHLLAAVEERGGTVAGGQDRLWLFDISNSTRPPLPLSYRDFATNNQNATAPLGYLDFGGGRLYANVVNNGILASTLDSVSTPLPVFFEDLQPTNRVAAGQIAHFEVIAYPAVTSYQWFTNGIALTGATNYYLDVANVQTADSGRVYRVDVTNPAGTVSSADSVLSVVNPSDLYHLNLLWSFAGGQTNYVSNNGGSTTPNERTIAYNALSNQVLVVRRNGANAFIAVVNADTGQFLYSLKTNGVGGAANIPVCGIAVADDGAVYVSSSSLAADQNFRVYRWADSGSNTLPVIIFGTNAFLTSASANPAQGVTSSQFRWGDNLAARGSGTGTQLLVDNQDAGTFRFAGVLRPTDSTMTNWSAKGLVLQNNLGGTSIGRSLQFGVGDTLWQKRFLASGAPLVQSSFNLSDPDPAVAAVQVISSAFPLSTNGDLGADFAVNHLGAAIEFSGSTSRPDTLDLYDLSNPTTPVLLTRNNFPANEVANGNFIGQVVFTTNYVFALDGNNGIMAFTLAVGPIPPPRILTQPVSLRLIEGGVGTLSVTVDQIVSYQWQQNGSNVGAATNANLVLSNVTTSAAGNYLCIASNANGMVTSGVASVAVGRKDDNYSLVQVWSTAQGTQTYLSNGGSTSPNERSISFNSLSNQLLVCRGHVNSSDHAIHVLDAGSGAFLYDMNTDSSIIIQTASEVSGSNGDDLNSVAAGPDGAVYACNLSPNASGGQTFDPSKLFRVYRWADTGSATPPVQIFSGDPANLTINARWGDSLTVRGSGLDTQLILDSQDGSQAAVLVPTDSSLTTFTNYPLSSGVGSGSIGRSIQFASGNNFWQKRKNSALYLSSIDTNALAANITSNFNNFPASLGGVGLDVSRNLAAGVDFVGSATAPDAVGLYDLTDSSTPMLLARYNFSTNQTANQNFICQTIITRDRVFSLDANNGLAMFNIKGPRLNINRVGSNVVLSWGLLADFQLQSSPSLSPASWTTIGPGTIVNGQYVVTNTPSSSTLFYRLAY